MRFSLEPTMTASRKAGRHVFTTLFVHYEAFREKMRYPSDTILTPFIQIQQTRKGLPNADINNCIAGIHKVRKHNQTAFKLFLYKMCLCKVDAKWFILRMVQYHNKRFV